MMKLSHAVLGVTFAFALPLSGEAATFGARFDTLTGAAPAVIAHRGAPAYLSENTLAGTELSVLQGAGWIENDVQPTKDGVLVVMHDGSLERTTDVETLFAPRNGGYNVADFTLEEIRTLTVDSQSHDYPGFTPSSENPFRVPTFAEQLDALTEYNAAYGTNVGIVAELKYGYDPASNQKAIDTLIAHGYDTPDKAILQSFSHENVYDVAGKLEEMGLTLPVSQLGGAALGLDGQFYIDGKITLAGLATYADALSLTSGSITEELIAAAHDLGLPVYGWTFRPADLNAAFAQMAQFIEWGIDGIITDNPDHAVAVVASYEVAPVPLPAALPLVLAGIGALGLVARRKRA
ncbi:hypothetical protein CG51_07070 [Haematobacter missouriensis]|nr:hypothetical protein CG51_07070 [Haematobacter missouriensis]